MEKERQGKGYFREKLGATTFDMSGAHENLKGYKGKEEE